LNLESLSTPSVLFQLLPKFLMDYRAGWGNHTNRDSTAPPVLNIYPLGRKTVPGTCERIEIGPFINRVTY
jgi:hypothetical protein